MDISLIERTVTISYSTVCGGVEVVAFNGGLFDDEGFRNGDEEEEDGRMDMPIRFEDEAVAGLLEDVYAERLGGERRRGRGSAAVLGTCFGSPVMETLPGMSYGVAGRSGGFSTESRSSSSDVDMAVGRFLFDVGLPPHAAKSVYFQQMLDVVASHGPGVVAPSYHDLRGWVLKNSLEEVKEEYKRLMGTVGGTGCSILVDQWDTAEGRVFINTFVYCSERTMFLKAVDVTEILSSEAALCELFKEVVEEVGSGNVVQVITNGMDHYIAAGSRLAEIYPTIESNTCSCSVSAIHS